MLTIRTERIELPSGTGPRSGTRMYWFPDRLIGPCWVGMSGYSATFLNGDHKLKTLEVALRCQARDTEFGRGVEVAATLFLSDKNADDRFYGWVEFVLFVELTAKRPPVGGPLDLDLDLAVR